MAADEERKPPFLRVVRGDATPEEVAAVVAVLASLQGSTAAPRALRPSWNSPERGLRRPHQSGPGGWRAGSLPR